ncbi:MAG: sulfatase-like hydrolase/transferase [Nitrospirae bacterium]|nr:sulfatase-like hydrolase/transferase [Candidatus Manganitrophaceae bacterium]
MSNLFSIKTWRKEWLVLTGIATLLVSLFELVLIQKRYSLFSEGFLSVHQLSSPSGILGFILVSLSADAAVLGFITMLLLLVSDRIGLKHPGRRLLILALAVTPLILTDFVYHRLADYLGDALDLSMMLELVGGNAFEFVAVGFEHLILPLFLFLALILVVAFFTWKLKKSLGNAPKQIVVKPSFRKIFIEVSLLFLFGFILLFFSRITNEAFDHGLKRKPSGQILGYFAETLSDIDRDGFGLLRRPADPDPFDEAIFPYALDIPGNGIDENGVAGDLPLDGADELEESEAGSRATQWQHTPHIIFVMLESFRADLIGATYEGKVVTPILADLASQGVSVESAFSHNGYTVQSRYHTFTGHLSPANKGRSLAEKSLIDDFKKNGYEVAFFSGQDESFGAEKMQIGFERADIAYDARVEVHRRYTKFSTPGSLGLPYDVLIERVKTFLSTRESTRPLFLYLNLVDTHFPYHHKTILPLINDVVLSRSEIRSERKNALKAMYLNTAANVDRAIGRVLDALRQVLGEAPGIIVTSDHGESLFEDNFLGHGYMINDAQTQIPLIVSGLPVVIEQPFGQSELRSVIHAALAKRPHESQKPILRENEKKQVFQYIGTIERPRQIAMRGLSGRIIYDFRSGLVQTEGKAWRRPELLENSEYSAFQKLVYFWERALIARND